MPYTRSPIEPELIEVKGGFFLMGNDEGPDDEKPAHEVWVDPFLIGKFTVTNHDYDVFMKSSQYPVPAPFRTHSYFEDPLHPIVGVSWFDAETYCAWLSRFTGHTYRLPTEAEWEYAARAGSSKNTYPWGARAWAERTDLHSYFQNGPEKVGSFEANSLGIHDMGMNVHEWCSDWYDKNYYFYSPAWNPLGAQDGMRRSSRGGSWRHQIKITRCAARSSLPPGMRYADYGFRVVMELSEKERRAQRPAR